jgi:hypothetical protein
VSELTVRLALLLIWAAIVSLDERAYGSYVFHQPLVAASVAGVLMGNLTGGMTAGLVFQCFWPGLLPIGGNPLPAVGLAGVLGGAVTSWGTHLAGTQALWSADGPLFFGVFLGLLAAGAGQLWERESRRRNTRREEEALEGPLPLEEGLRRALRSSYSDTALRGIVLVGVGVVLAGLVYLWPAGVRRMGRSPWVELGWTLPVAALGLGLGSLLVLLRGPGRRLSSELLWGLAAGIVIQLLRSL